MQLYGVIDPDFMNITEKSTLVASHHEHLFQNALLSLTTAPSFLDP
jgi:hypothetical protein